MLTRSQFLTAAYYCGCCSPTRRHRSKAHRYPWVVKGGRPWPTLAVEWPLYSEMLLFSACKIVTSGTYFENDRDHSTEMSTRVFWSVSDLVVAVSPARHHTRETRYLLGVTRRKTRPSLTNIPRGMNQREFLFSAFLKPAQAQFFIYKLCFTKIWWQDKKN